ncbi:MAG: 50S ribosome-binding GTPase [Candidatus Lokiarchaeota archaeon]|nr:50S ribosome-binding GTPase [Candidatus Lokiarchaeota archaeon]
MNEINKNKGIFSKKKIIVIGLDNCGKSSIVLCLRGIKNLMSFLTLKPTKGIDMDKINTMDTEITIWDYSGQAQYRTNHIQNLNEQIIDVNKLIYVIDIQDYKRYNLAVEYFGQILDIIKNNNNLIELSIFLHKWDPDLKLLKKPTKEEKIQNLVLKINKMIPNYIKYSIQKTSIYTIFQKTDIKIK